MSNNKKENLMALKEMLKNEIREDAQTVYGLEKGDYIANRVMGDMCDIIIDSRMSLTEKEYILSTMSYLLDIAKTGVVLNAMSDEERQKAVDESAENYIKKA